MRHASESKKNVALRGSSKPLRQPVLLRAGHLSLLYSDGELRNFLAGDLELVRRMYVAVRDKYWNTVRPAVANLRIRRGRNSFSIRFDCIHRRDGIDFVWHASIEGLETGAVSFSLDGTARLSFETNRIGFCVLLPLEGCLGKPCGVEKVDGTRIRARFPGETISPHQPFANMRALVLTFAGGVSSEIRFEGDTFEMEDQRNWTDASFKVYCPPLADNIPFRVKKGARFSQRILVRLTSKTKPRPFSLPHRDDALEFSRRSCPIPEIGTALCDAVRTIPAREAELVRACGFSHVRSDFRFDDRKALQTVSRAAGSAAVFGCSLELALSFGGGPHSIVKDAGRLADIIDGFHVPVKRCLVFRSGEKVTSQETRGAFYAGAPRLFDQTEMISGTDGNFVEINRNKPALRGAEGVCYSDQSAGAHLR